MKKTISTIGLGILVTFVSSCSNEPKNWLEANNIKGNVSCVTDSVWLGDIKFGEPTKNYLQCVRVYTLNNDGNLASLTEYDGYGDIENKYVYKWEGKHLVESNAYGADGAPSSKTINTFDGDKLTKVVFEDYKNNNNIVADYYYGKDKLDSIVSKSKDGKTIEQIKWIDDNDSYTSTTIFPNGSKETITIYNDSQKRIIKMESNDLYTYHYGTDGNEDSGTYSHYRYRYTYKYDSKKNWIEKVSYQKWGKEQENISEIITRHYDYK